MTKIKSAYERGRLQKIARIARAGCVLDIGYAQFPNPFCAGVETTGLAMALPADPGGYAEGIQGSALDLPAVLEGRRFDWIVAGSFIEYVRNP